MEEKIKELYGFLQKNRQYNKEVQEGFIKSCIAIKDLSPEQKVLNLLYGVVNTQSQPKMDKIEFEFSDRTWVLIAVFLQGIIFFIVFHFILDSQLI